MSGAKNCPETPRQKMIGMMYLVLTAMLALNVSTDILKAFKLVDDSLHTTLETTDARNRQLMSQFLLDRNDNPEKNGPWYDKAAELTQRSDSLFNYIQDFKYQIALATDGDKADPNAREIVGNDNRDATTHYALPNSSTHQPGLELKKHLNEYRDYLISLDTTRRAEFEAMFDTSDKAQQDGDVITWETQMFHDMPSGAAVTLMTKLQNDIRNAQNILIQHLRRQTDAGDLRVNKLNAYVIPNSNVVIRGGKYTAQIILAAIDSTQTPEYYVEGQRINDQGLYEVAATSTGLKTYSGWISYLNPASNQMEQLPFSSEYSVTDPSVTISNTELNVMYSGHENKFSISVPGVSNDKIKVSVSGAQSKPSGSGTWTITPADKVKEVTITVSAEMDGKMLTMPAQKYRVKPLPDPTAYFSANSKEYASGAKVPYARFKDGELIASYGPDGLLQVPWTVTSFAATIGGITFNSKNNKFTKEMLNRMSKLDNGSLIMLSEIDAVGEKGTKKRLQSIAIVLN